MPAKRHFTSYTKEEIRKSTAIIANQKTLEATVYLSKVKFDDTDDINSYVVCEHCSFRSGQLDQHLKKWHNQTTAQYKLQFPNSPCVSKNASGRVIGDKNPAFGHGGKLSKFSKNFIKYEGLSEEEISKQQNDAFQKAQKTRDENPHKINTKLEYYTSKGMTEAEAKVALSERQSTFSLDKCIEKFGNIDGKIIWQARQDKWQNTLKDIPSDLMEEYNRKKSNQREYFVDRNIKTGVLYFIKVKDGYYKIGISKDSAYGRYDKKLPQFESILYESNNMDINKLSLIEKIVKMNFTKYALKKADEILPFGWTESFSTDVSGSMEILSSIELIIERDKSELENLFENVVRYSR